MKFDVKIVFDMSDSRLITINNKNIIYIKRYNNTFLDIYKYTFIDLNKVKTEFLYIFRKVLISNSGRLLQIIECLIQLINLKAILIEIIGLSYLDFFLNVLIEKGDFDIYLFQILIYSRRKREDRLITYKLYY